MQNSFVNSSVGQDHLLSKRSAEKKLMFDANGNRILHVVCKEAADVADVETEKVIQ